VELTPAGESSFLQLRDAAMSFDARLRQGISEQEIAGLGSLLDRLAANVAGPDDGPAWTGLAERPS